MNLQNKKSVINDLDKDLMEGHKAIKEGITLDENNNMILNDSYDFPDYDESKAKDLFMRIHNMFEPRGQTGKEGLLSGIFEVDQPRKMRINLGPAPKAIAALINPKEERSLLVAGL